MVATFTLGVFAATSGVTSGAGDFGTDVQQMLEAKSMQQFGVNSGLPQSSPLSISAAEATAAPNIDQMVLWPNDQSPTHLIACNEEGVAQAGVQRIRLSDGLAETIVTGTTSCDPVRKTPWGTVLFGEEAGGGANGGRMYELIDPLNTSGVTLNRVTGVFSGGTGATNLVARPSL